MPIIGNRAFIKSGMSLQHGCTAHEKSTSPSQQRKMDNRDLKRDWKTSNQLRWSTGDCAQ
jgi:hypothetical protein